MATGIQATVIYNHFPAISAGLAAKADALVGKAALDIQAGAQERAPVRTGFLKNSIQANRVGAHHWRVTVGADYGIYVEHGTRHMAARPYLEPSITHVRPQFLEAMARIFGSV